MKDFTVSDLLKAAEEAVKAGHGDKVVYLSDDDEGNGYHKMSFSFSIVDGFEESYYGLNRNTDIILG